MVKSNALTGALVVLLALGWAKSTWGESMEFNCRYSMKASSAGLKADSLTIRFLLDSGRKKAYRMQGKQMNPVQYHIDVKNGTVNFLEVTSENEVKFTSVDVRRNSAHSLAMSQYYGFCQVN